MMENILTNYRNYIEGHKGAADAYTAGRKELNENYKGAMLKSKLDTLKEAHSTTVKALEGEYITPIKESFETAKASVRAVLACPIPNDVLNSLAALEGLNISNEEKSQILEMTKNSYLARKRAIELLNVTEDELPPSIDDVLEGITTIENCVIGSIDKPTDSYDARLICHGDWVNSVQGEVTAFCEAYGEQE